MLHNLPASPLRKTQPSLTPTPAHASPCQPPSLPWARFQDGELGPGSSTLGPGVSPFLSGHRENEGQQHPPLLAGTRTSEVNAKAEN